MISDCFLSCCTQVLLPTEISVTLWGNHNFSSFAEKSERHVEKKKDDQVLQSKVELGSRMEKTCDGRLWDGEEAMQATFTSVHVAKQPISIPSCTTYFLGLCTAQGVCLLPGVLVSLAFLSSAALVESSQRLCPGDFSGSSNVL